MNRKTIAMPGRYDLDLTPIQPIIDTPLFQKLRWRRQLGLSFLVFPCANHTRFEHSLGTYALALERANYWHRNGEISPDDAHHMTLCALVHDLGHGPYSHASEALCKIDHEQHGIMILDEITPAIRKCGGDPNRIRSLLKHSDPQHCCVTHRPLGVDKLDYLTRDARYTNEAVSLRLGDLLNHTYYIDQQITVDQKIIAEVAQAQLDYVYMYDRVYLRKACLIIQRFLQQIITREMAQSDTLPEEKLLRLTDSELDTVLLTSREPMVRNLFQRLRNRSLPKTAIRLIPIDIVNHDRISDKSIATHKLLPNELRRFDQFQHPDDATAIETEIAELAGIPPEAVLIVPIATPARFVPEDISVCDNSNIIGSLRDLRPAHYANLEEIACAYAAVRICVFEEYRAKVAAPACANRIVKHLIAAVH